MFSTLLIMLKSGASLNSSIKMLLGDGITPVLDVLATDVIRISGEEKTIYRSRLG